MHKNTKTPLRGRGYLLCQVVKIRYAFGVFCKANRISTTWSDSEYQCLFEFLPPRPLRY